jgi:hypothetical protein
MEARLTLRRLLALVAIATAVAVTSACGGGGDAQAAAKDPPLQNYSGSGLSFSYPATWTAYPGKQAELHFQPLVYLSTQPVHDPCSTKGKVTTCGFPVDRLKPGGVLVMWQKYGIPAMGLGPGARIRVGGDPATFVDKPGGACRKIGADRTIEAVVQTSPPPAAFTYLTACLREPGTAENGRSVNALLASTKFLSD